MTSQPAYNGHKFIEGRCDKCGKGQTRLEGEGMPKCASVEILRNADAAVYAPSSILRLVSKDEH